MLLVEKPPSSIAFGMCDGPVKELSVVFQSLGLGLGLGLRCHDGCCLMLDSRRGTFPISWIWVFRRGAMFVVQTNSAAREVSCPKKGCITDGLSPHQLLWLVPALNGTNLNLLLLSDRIGSVRPNILIHRYQSSSSYSQRCIKS
jgi:hypothetical protein